MPLRLPTSLFRTRLPLPRSSILPSRHPTSTRHPRRTTTLPHQTKPLPIDALPRYPTLTATGTLRLFDYIGTLSFAHTGALLAATSGMDLLGTTVVGTITAVGGGTLRDAIILSKRPFWTEETEYLYLCWIAAGTTFFLWPREWGAYEGVMTFLTDALGVGAFCVVGAMNGVRAGVGGVVCVICAVATATFGGVVRDVLCRREVRILHSRAEIYASAAVTGGSLYWLARHRGVGVWGRVLGGVGAAFGTRLVAWNWGVRLPVWDGKDVDGDDDTSLKVRWEGEKDVFKGKVDN